MLVYYKISNYHFQDTFHSKLPQLCFLESKALRHNAKFAEQNFSLEKPLKDIVSKQVYSLSSWQKRLPNIATTEFAADKVDYGYDMPETLSRETMVPRSDPLDDPFVADDTFQDQGPGSMEIYKLDLSKEKALLTATTPPTNSPSRNKSKAPKKTVHLKTKTTESKSTTIDSKVHHKQSNFFEDQRTETPSVNRDVFGVGGVPELQVGCEGLEASPSSHKAKRSIDTPDKEEGVVPASVLLDVMPISLDLDYNLSYDEENYEEMDELFKLKKLEAAIKKNKPNRGDMDASHLNSDHLDESRSDRLPIRGDLGEPIRRKSRGLEKSEKSTNLEVKKRTKAKRALTLSNDARNRRLLRLAEANTEGFAAGKSERKRARRSANWGFGENEGVVSSDELQTVNERRRQHEMRYHQDVSRGRDQHRGINPDADNIRREYENLLEQKRKEEEERRMQQGGRKTLNRWEEEERRRDEMRKTQHDKHRNRMDHTSTPRMDDEETRRRQMEERQRQMEERQRQEMERNRAQEMARREEEERRRFREEEERRRRLQEEEKTKKRPYNNKWKEENSKRSEPESNEEKKQRFPDEETRRREEERQRQLEKEEARRREQYRSQQEALRRKEEEERRRQEDRAKNLSEDDRRQLEERRREWLEKKRQQEEDETRRQQPPSNLMRKGHRIGHPNDVRQRDRDEERRMREEDERQREQKLRDYIARNKPINVTHVDRRPKEQKRRYRPEEGRDPRRMNASRDDEEYRRRQEEERKLQDYIRRNQPVNVPSRSNQSAVTDRNWFEERRLIEEARHRDPISYPDSEAKRQHGPSAPTYNIDRRTSPEEVRRRQQETERRLKEARRQRNEAEERRKELARRQEQERRLREERMRREEATRREEEARKVQSRRYEEDRKRLEAVKLQAERRRQEMLKERSRSEAGRTRQPQVTRPTYQNPRLLVEHRRRQDSLPIPSNFLRDEEARRVAAERERQRLEAERRRQDESR